MNPRFLLGLNVLMLLGAVVAFAGTVPVASAACTVNVGDCDDGDCLVNAGTCEEVSCGWLTCTGGCGVNVGYCSGLCFVNVGTCESGVDDAWPTYAGCYVNLGTCHAGGQCLVNVLAFCQGDCDVNAWGPCHDDAGCNVNAGTCDSAGRCIVNSGHCDDACPVNGGNCWINVGSAHIRDRLLP